MMWPYYAGGGWSMLWGMGMMALFWVALIVLVVWIVRTIATPRSTADTAMETLRRRLAAGEISPDDFEKTKKALGA